MRLCAILLIFSFICISTILCSENFYDILGVAKDADDRTIRKAFKKLAIQKHPDKNKDNPDSHAEFLKINRAYEVLKDEEMRKRYDQYGEKGLADDFNPNQNFQSWQFYRDKFGIYDDDVEIVTLNRADFTQLVSESSDIWFINFYSTYCSHCHQLAPTWRKFATAMDGVIRIGAVNCAEDPGLCQSQYVNAYPSLRWYPEGSLYQGPRDVEALVEFVMSRLPNNVIEVSNDNYLILSQQNGETATKPWIIDFCDDSDRCLTPINRRKLSAMLAGLVNVGTVDCHYGSKDAFCDAFDRTDGVLWFSEGRVEPGLEIVLDSLDPKELSTIALRNMDGLTEIDDDDVKSLFDHHIGAMENTAVWFVKDQSTVEENRDMIRLKAAFTDVKVFFFDCASGGSICADHMDIAKLPTTILFKAIGGYDINYVTSKSGWRDQATFVRESLKSPIRVLTPETHDEAIASGDLWLIDYFAPWCPPCMRLMAELRQVHTNLDEASQSLSIGTVDCTRHLPLCQKAGVSSYPHKKLFYQNKEFSSVGYSSVHEVIDFLEDCLNPSVVELDESTFESEVKNKPAEKTWVVSFCLPSIGYCQQLIPEFHKTARYIKDYDAEIAENVKYGSVNCEKHMSICNKERITAYPWIRLYTAKSVREQRKFGAEINYPQNMWRNADSILQWTLGLLPSLVVNMGNEFFDEVLNSKTPWLVDFYMPWCGPCQAFGPVFDQVAKVLEGKVQLAKINCEQHPNVCHGAQIPAYPTVRLYRGVRNNRKQDIWGLNIQSQNKDHIVEVVKNYIGISGRDEL